MLETVFPTACQECRLAEPLAWPVTGNCAALVSEGGSLAVLCAHMQLRFGAMVPGCSTESVPRFAEPNGSNTRKCKAEYVINLADEAVL